MNKEQFGKELILKDKKTFSIKTLRYFITENPIGIGYSDMKNYGIEIECIENIAGSQEIRDLKSISSIFFDLEDAKSFIGFLKRKKAMPDELNSLLEEFIKISLKAQKNKLVINNCL